MGIARLAVVAFLVAVVGCKRTPPAQSISGVKMASVGTVQTDDGGHTIEQQNILERIKRDNELGAMKHLYIISAYSGQTILYSPVKGKVTSGSKRLNPRNIDGIWSDAASKPTVKVGDVYYTVSELAGEDGTYGTASNDYLFWFTPSGEYMQFYITGGTTVLISDKPLNVKSVIVNVETTQKP